MIVGEHNRSQDLELKKTKQLTNHRASSGEELVQLQAPVDMSLERALEYIGPDELVVTPKSIRLRRWRKASKAILGAEYKPRC